MMQSCLQGVQPFFVRFFHVGMLAHLAPGVG